METALKFVDMHSHWATERGYVLRTPEELARQAITWRSEAKYRTEDEQAADLRAAGVKTILDLSFTKKLPIEQTSEFHDYAFSVQRKYPDCVIGNWISSLVLKRVPSRCANSDAVSMPRRGSSGSAYQGVAASRQAIRSGSPSTTFVSRRTSRC